MKVKLEWPQNSFDGPTIDEFVKIMFLPEPAALGIDA
jgi:hypothetical protein